MKKSLLFLTLILLLSSQMFSQENTNTTNTVDAPTNFNEIKLNGLFLILGAFEATYERTINEESAFGITAHVTFDDDINTDVNYFISPYYRFYFGKKYAAGFFVEGFGMLNSTNTYIYTDSFNDDNMEQNTDFALGFGVGGKWLTKSGFSVELYGGIGRNLFNNDSNSDFLIIGKGGINFGYRF